MGQIQDCTDLLISSSLLQKASKCISQNVKFLLEPKSFCCPNLIEHKTRVLSMQEVLVGEPMHTPPNTSCVPERLASWLIHQQILSGGRYKADHTSCTYRKQPCKRLWKTTCSPNSHPPRGWAAIHLLQNTFGETKQKKYHINVKLRRQGLF